MKKKTIPHEQYEKFNCCLIQYKAPLLKACFILCHEPEQSPQSSQYNLLTFAYQEAERLSQQYTNSSENYMLAMSGQNIRRRANWHIHIFIVQHRWQKAYVYNMLGIKNLGLALYYATKKTL